MVTPSWTDGAIAGLIGKGGGTEELEFGSVTVMMQTKTKWE